MKIFFKTGSQTDVQGSSPGVCPLLGSNFHTQFSQSNRARLFMNFGAPAQCNGTVTSWHYCSYNEYIHCDDDADDDDDYDDDDDDDDSDGSCRSQHYTSKFLVYRQTGPSTYQPTPGSTKLVTLSLTVPSDGGFQCRNISLSQPEQFIIQKNDIVAACLMDNRSTNPIRIVGEQNSGPSKQVYRYNADNYEDCTVSQLQTININTQDGTFLQSIKYRLHLYAETTGNSVHAHKPILLVVYCYYYCI